MTWNGAQGFHTPVENESSVVDGLGPLGNMHSERGLAYFEVAHNRHMIPEFFPKAAFQIMKYLMGFQANP